MSIQACLSLIRCVLFYCKRPEIQFSSSDKDKIQRSHSGSDPQPPRRFFPLHGRRHRDLRCQALARLSPSVTTRRSFAAPLTAAVLRLSSPENRKYLNPARQPFPMQRKYIDPAILPRLPEAELQRVQENVLSLYINSRIELDSITLFISQPASVGIMHIAVELEFPCLRICHEIRKDIPCRRIFSALRPEYIPSSGEMGLQPAASYASPSDFF